MPRIFKGALAAYVGGINDRGAIPGSYETNGKQWFSFIIRPPYRHLKLERGQVVVTGISNDGTISGYVINPASLEGIWGAIRVGAVWSLFSDPHEGHGNSAVTELLGVNDEGKAVGFYTNDLGENVAAILDIRKAKFNDLHPPGSAAAYAVSMNDNGDVVGSTTGKSRQTGFLLKKGRYTELSYPGSQATFASAINLHDEVVGDYLDASGGLHGFLLTDPVKRPHWRSFDYKSADRGTALTGINDRGELDGYYIDENGHTRPFICS